MVIPDTILIREIEEDRVKWSISPVHLFTTKQKDA